VSKLRQQMPTPKGSARGRRGVAATPIKSIIQKIIGMFLFYSEMPTPPDTLPTPCRHPRGRGLFVYSHNSYKPFSVLFFRSPTLLFFFFQKRVIINFLHSRGRNYQLRQNYGN